MDSGDVISWLGSHSNETRRQKSSDQETRKMALVTKRMSVLQALFRFIFERKEGCL